MKNIKYLIICLAVLLFTGCGKKDQMVDFIPTPTPEEDSIIEDTIEGNIEETGEDTSEESDESAEGGSNNKPIVVGKTTTMYVKMKEYGDTLNVRSEPSTKGKVVGSLVHTEKIEVIKIENGWACFVLNNQYAYVSADYLADKRPEYLDPPTPAPTQTPTPSPIPSPEPTQEELNNPPEI